MSYQIGQIVEGKVTGIQSYGAFVSLDPKTSGLIHISEISDGFVRDVGLFVHVGDTVRVKVIDYDEKEHKAKLSLKALNRHRPRQWRRMSMQRVSLPSMRIGFSSIAEHLDGWIREAEKEAGKNDEV